MIDRKKSFRFVLDCLLIAALAFVFALNYELFVAPNRFAPSGVNGIAAMVEYVTDGAFSVGYFSLLVNIPLCLFAFFLIDRGFAVKTFVFSLVYSGALLLLRMVDLTSFRYDAENVDTIFPALIAGAVSGFVYGIVVLVFLCQDSQPQANRYGPSPKYKTEDAASDSTDTTDRWQ